MSQSIAKTDYLSYGYGFAVIAGGLIGYVKAGNFAYKKIIEKQFYFLFKFRKYSFFGCWSVIRCCCNLWCHVDLSKSKKLSCSFIN